jgi:hypothetical protein
MGSLVGRSGRRFKCRGTSTGDPADWAYKRAQDDGDIIVTDGNNAEAADIKFIWKSRRKCDRVGTYWAATGMRPIDRTGRVLDCSSALRDIKKAG